MQDAEMPAEEIGQSSLGLCGGPIALWGEKALSEAVQSQLFRCAP
jgi:hypothetical protein